VSPLEEYQQEKRSGLYHPDTEKNWPTKQVDPYPDSTIIEPPAPTPVVEIERPVPAASNVVVAQPSDIIWIHIFLIIILVLQLISLYGILSNKAPVVEAKPAVAQVMYKTHYKTLYKTKVKKIYVAASPIWRKTLCYKYGDWNACTAYKKDLPWRARLGRTDL